MIITFDGDLTEFYLDLKQNQNEKMLGKYQNLQIKAVNQQIKKWHIY